MEIRNVVKNSITFYCLKDIMDVHGIRLYKYNSLKLDEDYTHVVIKGVAYVYVTNSGLAKLAKIQGKPSTVGVWETIIKSYN